MLKLTIFGRRFVYDTYNAAVDVGAHVVLGRGYTVCLQTHNGMLCTPHSTCISHESRPAFNCQCDKLPHANSLWCPNLPLQMHGCYKTVSP